jgi:hypothetical protein
MWTVDGCVFSNTILVPVAAAGLRVGVKMRMRNQVKIRTWAEAKKEEPGRKFE